ncbi:hypothetical protein SAY87_019110 [Trapa incisa]|uniref:Fibronectin type-III domain-containing protein n=1 Tax=Trapa incisa TaxID=236973 RepID=A0AAN7K1S3_9MYRT|nr:hypothetical protein SAY87_019110 [Trapa incisa]
MMSMEEKRDFVYQISKWPYGASELLQPWSRQEILQILCLEMGKERKYTGMTKLKMIEHLLKTVSEKRFADADKEDETLGNPRPYKSQRKEEKENLSEEHVPIGSISTEKLANEPDNTVICKNTACKARLSREDKFCKRCSCCICYKYDDNKDPSLWLTCSSEMPYQCDSCGMSCHLECALKNESTKIAKGVQRGGLDGIFFCASCGKVNDILWCWRKQLMVAKETRRVDILCYRLALAKKLISGTERYKEISGIVEEAVKKLEEEVGPLSGVPVKLGRGIVNRLSFGSMIQKLCMSAVELLDSVLSSLATSSSPKSILQGPVIGSKRLLKFEDIGPTSITVVLESDDSQAGSSIMYNLWHRGANESNYPLQATCSLSSPERRFTVLGLTPSSEYFFRVVLSDGIKELGSFEVCSSTNSIPANETSNQILVERSQSPLTHCSSFSNPSSVEDETNNLAPCSNQNGSEPGNYQLVDINYPRIGKGHVLKDAGPLGAMAIDSTIPDSDGVNKNIDQTVEGRRADEGLCKNTVHFANSLPEASLPITPCKAEKHNSKNGSGRAHRAKHRIDSTDHENRFRFGSTSARQRNESKHINNDGQSPDQDFEFYVKLIRWLECEGHIEKNFRQKFLTWYTLRATSEEVRIVKVFVDTFIEDPASLAEQLVDTFSDCILSNGSSSVVPSGFCMKLWH